MVNTILGFFRKAGDEDPLADAKALAAWVAKQPTNDYLGLQEAMVRVLEDMAARQPKLTASRVLAVLELDRISMPIQARLLKQFLQPTLSDSVRQRLWHACDDLARWFAYTYESLFDGLQEFFLRQTAKGQLPGVAARMFFYRGQQGKNGLFRYERWVPGKWKSLHAAYEASLERDLARAPFALTAASPASEHYSAEQEYLQILLMQRVNTGNLSALQIETVALWLRTWVRDLVLTEPPPEGPGFWLDLGLGDGLLARKPQSTQGTLLYLDVAPLENDISNAQIELGVQMERADATADQTEATERLVLLQRLAQLWRPKSKPIERRGVRVHANCPVNVAAGLVEIVAELSRRDPTKQAVYQQSRYGDPVKVASSRMQPALRSTDPSVIEFEQGNASGWHMHDISESGCKLVSHAREAAQQKLGSLLGIQEQDDARWKIGIVRRLRKVSVGEIELGVELIAHNSLLIAPRRVAPRDAGYSVDGIDVSAAGKGIDALYLPPMQNPGQPTRRSIVVPAPEYGEHRRLFLPFDNTAYTIELTTALERTKDWVWSGFEIVTQAK